MMNKKHQYLVTIKWTGNKGEGTKGYSSYERSHIIKIKNKVEILSSSDPTFRGDKTKHNPEELFLASISACHMLWYLHLCCNAGIIVLDYIDNAEATMIETSSGNGRFTEVKLYPEITVSKKSMITKANDLHKKANELCFIANSCNFPILHKPSCKSAED